MKKQDIINAWTTMRETNNTIPDEVLDFMKESALANLKDDTYLHVGDEVMWRGGWGTDPAKKVTVTSIEKNIDFDSKDGDKVDKIKWSKLTDRVIVNVSNGKWAYGSQIDQIK